MEAILNKIPKSIKFLSLIILTLLFIVLIIPPVLSSSWGTRQLTQILNNQIPGTLSLKGLNLSWFNGQSVEGFKLQDPEGKPVLGWSQAQTDASLINLALNGVQTGQVAVNDLYANLREESPGNTNLQRALGERFLSKQIFSPQTRSQTLPDVSLEHVNATLKFPDHTHTFLANATGTAEQNNIKGQFQIDLSQSTPHTEINVNIEDLPTSLIDQIVAMYQPELLGLSQTLLGDRINVTAHNTASSDGSVFSLEATSPMLKASLAGSVNDDKLTLSQPAKASLTITPTAIKLLENLHEGLSAVTLLKPARAELTLNQLELPFSHPEQLLTAADLFFPNVRFSSQNGGATEINGLTLQAKGSLKQLAGTVKLDSIKGDFAKDPLNLKDVTLSWEAELNANANKKVNINIKGNQLNGQAAFQVEKERVINKDNISLSLDITPSVGKSVLHDAIPILGGVTSADAPIKITIPAKGFVFPLQGFSIGSLFIRNATIELGKMHFKNEGELGTVFSLLKKSNQEALTVWFTPLYLHLEKGLLQLDRMDMLMLNRYPMAVWGKVDLAKEKVDMRIGITGAALNEALGTSVNGNDMLQIPLKGKMGEASIDKTQAAARISSLIAQSSGSTQGLVVGTLLGFAGGTHTESPVPLPTTSPLPWESLLNSTPTSKQSKSEKESKKHKSSTSDQIQKAASSLLNSLF